MKLTLGQAAKEAGISKPSLSAAIKKGRLSAYKNEQGTYEIDPAELFRVYPPKQEANTSDNGLALPQTNPVKITGKGPNDEVLALLLAEKDKLLEEKERAIERLLAEKSDIREDLEEQREQAKRLTLLLTDQSKSSETRAGNWDKTITELKDRVSNQEKILRQNQALKKALTEEKSKSFFKKLFG